MDQAHSAAARALENGDVLAALRLVALREDAMSLALRGLSMAQLGELARARALLSRARRSLSPREIHQRARVSLAESELAIAMRELPIAGRAIERAGAILLAAGDEANALFARVLDVQRLVLLGSIDEASERLSTLNLNGATPATLARAELLKVEIASRRIDAKRARAAIQCAQKAAQRAGIPALAREVEHASRALLRPVMRLIAQGREESLTLDGVERVFASRALIVNALKREIGTVSGAIDLARRPVLFSLARMLGERYPGGASRESLIACAFGMQRTNETHRARLRVEVARLRRVVAELARIEATAEGFVLVPRGTEGVMVLAPPVEGENGAVRALIADGQAWSSSAIALALGMSQRSIQRILAVLERDGHVCARGSARMRRWFAPPISGFATTLLLPSALGLG
jgi:hypothetical protein